MTFKTSSRIALVALFLLAPMLQAHAIEPGLKTGSSGTDVSYLQQMLQEQGFYTYPDITGYFGSVTKQAVIAFQEAYTDLMLAPLNLSHGTGIVGDLTAAALNASVGFNNSTSTPALTFYASHTSLNLGQGATLLWTSTSTTTCTASGGWSGVQHVRGSLHVKPLVTTSYTLTCTQGQRSVEKTATITVASSAGTAPGTPQGPGVPIPARPPIATTTPPNDPNWPNKPPIATSTPPIATSTPPVATTTPIVSGGQYYIDFVGGADTNSGSMSSPWKHAPGDANATGNPAAVKLAPGSTLFFKGGVHYYGSVKVNASGATNNPITLRGDAWGTGKAILDGSDAVDNWTLCSSQSDCGGNPNWTNIYKTTLTSVPSFLKREPEIRLNLIQGGQIIIPAQSPSSTSRYYQNRTNYNSVTKSQVTTTTITDPRLAALGGYSLIGSFAYIWAVPNDIFFHKITGYNASTQTISFAAINPYPNSDTQYAIANANTAGVFNAAGEYYFNLATKTLYVWPLGGVNPNGQITMGVRAFGVDLNTQSHIAIQGFLIEGQTGDFSGSGAGIKKSIISPTSDITVANNEVTLTQSDGFGAMSFALVNGLTIQDNYVHDVLGNMRGIQVLNGSNILVKNNHLRNIARTGIYFAGVSNARMTGNLMTDSDSTHGNGLTVYQGSNNVTVDSNTVIDANIAFTMERSSNINIYNNVFDGAGNVNKVVADWGSMTGSNVFRNNTVVGSNNKGALYLGSSDGSYVVQNNIVEGDITTVRPSVTRSGNVYTATGGFQSSKYGWSLSPGESVAIPSAVFVAPGTRTYTTTAAYKTYGSSL